MRVPLYEADVPQAVERRRILEMAFSFQLSAYDAAYLELADRLKIPLLTGDKVLGKASLELNLGS